MKRRKRLMCAEIGEVKYEEMFENELLMHMDLERILEKSGECLAGILLADYKTFL